MCGHCHLINVIVGREPVKEAERTTGSKLQAITTRLEFDPVHSSMVNGLGNSQVSSLNLFSAMTRIVDFSFLSED